MRCGRSAGNSYYVAGPQVLVDYSNSGRPYLFSSATTAADVAARIAAVEILQQSDHAVQQLWRIHDFFRQHCGP